MILRFQYMQLKFLFGYVFLVLIHAFPEIVMQISYSNIMNYSIMGYFASAQVFPNGFTTQQNLF